MRWSLLILLLLFFSCQSLTETEKLHRSLTGDWLILYPDHGLNNRAQKEVYAKMQDSIISLKGLKLITLSDNGVFEQTDSVDLNGKWGITTENMVFFQNGGKGFESFSARFTGYDKAVLRLTELIYAKGEKIRLVWHLKRIEGRTAAALFDTHSNVWRKRPVQKESPREMKERLAAMLQYYSVYYSLVNKESSYFIPSRVILPFKFYQHAVGLKPFDTETAFAGLFFDTMQAKEAYQYLDRTMDRLTGRFPASGANYVEEYAEYMKLMAGEITRLE